MKNLIRRLDFRNLDPETARELLKREWLATNGLGGYASSTISGRVTWRYHGLLIAALPAPFGRTVMLNQLSDWLILPDGRRCALSPELQPGEQAQPHYLTEFRLENGLPVWQYAIGDVLLEKYVLFLHQQNTVHVHYRMLEGPSGVVLNLAPSVHFRGHERPVDYAPQLCYEVVAYGNHYQVNPDRSVEDQCPGTVPGDSLPPLRIVLAADHAALTYDCGTRREVYYQKEADRGNPARGWLWCPGHFTMSLQPRRDATLIASTEPWSTMLALSAEEALSFYHSRHKRLVRLPGQHTTKSPAADLVLAADGFIITPAGRIQDAARARAAGDDIRTVIAGYHWFTDWGRDTMISLEGLTLTTNRFAEAGWILRTFAYYIRDGLIPNLFPEGKNEGLYHTADATLWFFHALDRYVELTGDRDTLRLILPKLQDIVEHHLQGTRFGIRVDPRDGLLTQGERGYQLTWMDAKVEDWVVTPRRGKAVEINGLWYNALRLLQAWLEQEGKAKEAQTIAGHAERARDSFNRRFWYVPGNYLFDIVDGENGEDPSIRPNQLLAFSLKHPVLAKERWESVLKVVTEQLLTPVGLRTLAPGSPDYKAKYFGDLRARDAAYHQGTVWAWLIGPLVDAWLKLHPEDKAGARKFLEGFVRHLDEGCVGSINEIFDAEAPFAPRGCISQAWSVAEVLRCWVKTAS